MFLLLTKLCRHNFDTAIQHTIPFIIIKLQKQSVTIAGKPVSKNNTTTGVYAQACSKVAEELGTKYVDLYNAMMKREVSHIFYYSYFKKY